MPITVAPRSVSDATRFTPTTPHANSKAAVPAPELSSRFAVPKGGIPSSGGGGHNGGPGSGGRFYETPDQKVARLRAAHQKAKLAQVSKLDKVVDGGRRLFDSAHKFAVMGLIGFTVLASLVTVYTAADMMMYNKKRKAEFIEAQKRLEADSLDAARLAYMTGKATDEQIALVEEVMEQERKAGRVGTGHSSIFSKLPPVLAVPSAETPKVSVAAAWPSSTTAAEEASTGAKPKSGLWNWMTSSLKKEEEGDDFGTSEHRLGFESLSEEDDSTGVRDSDMVRAVEDKAREAFQKEKENQKKGGPLDRVGLDAKPAAEEPKKKGWW
ncbi:cytochrome oxidase c assembly-domain-containing protein [Podospora appendiculata]|uniref:Cytochrome oxidase c assembly-domain-containing protein n=1 Tax=Podospora appendiculata TaxID=314037 RepID=A0AAE0X0R8_9PEZI|nr:cytochrome oxidase c assembly-domain-containing protein [Podospora appendiculata]